MRSRRRSPHRSWALLGALLLVAAVVTGLMATITTLLDHRAGEGIRGEFAGRSGDDLALRLSLPLADDPDAQDAAVRGAIEGDFARADSAIAIDRIVEGQVQLFIDASPGFTGPAVALSVPNLDQRAELVAGEWSGASGATTQATMQADAAAALGIEPGASIVLNGETVEVTGTWRVTDAFDPRWIDAQLVIDGASRGRVAVVVIAESEWARLGAEPQATWSVIPDITTLTGRDLSVMPRAWSLLSRSLSDSLGVLDGLERRGGFVEAANEISASVSGLSAVEPVVLVLIAIVGVATLARLARLLSRDRIDETRLRWSRGASMRSIVGRATVEAFVASALGAMLGVALAVWLCTVIGAGSSIGLPSMLLAAALVITAATAFTASAAWRIVRQLDANSDATSTRGARSAGLGAVILVSAAAAVSTWQLQLYGSPLVPDARGELSVDPVMVVAPPLLLIAGVLIAAASVPVISRALDRVRSRSSVVGALALSSVARRPETATASIAMSALAVAVIVLAAGYSGTWSLAFDRSAQSRAGSDIAATVPVGLDADSVDAVSALAGVRATAVVHVEDFQIGGEQFTLVAATPDALGTLVAPEALANSSALAEQLRVAVPGPVVPGTTDRIVLSASVTGFATPPAASLIVSDASGAERELALTAAVADPAAPGTVEYSAEVPESLSGVVGPLRVLAVGATIVPGSVAFETTGVWEILSMTAAGPDGDTEVDIETYWSPTSLVLTLDQPLSSPTGRGFVVDSSARTVRLTPRILVESAVPVVISQSLADAVDAQAGATISLRSVGSESPFAGLVVAVVPAVPSAPQPEALLMDLSVVRALQFQSTGPILPFRLLWIAADDPVATVDAARAVLPPGSRMNDAAEQPLRTALGAAALALWVTAGAAALLTLTVIAAAGRAEHRGRRREVAVLRALGLRRSSQGAIRFSEAALIAVAGAAGGIATGAAVILLTVVPFARAALPAVVPAAATPLSADLGAASAALAAVAVGLLLVAAAAATRAVRDSRAVDGGEFDA